MLKNEDLEYIASLLEPLYVLQRIPTSPYDKNLEFVIKAEETYSLILKDIKNFIKYVKQRDNVKSSDLESALALRVFNIPISFNRMDFMDQSTSWCQFITKVTNDKNNMPGMVTIKGLDNYTQKQFDLSVMKAVSSFFKDYYSFNLSLLRNYIWGRNNNNIMTYIKYNKQDDIIPYCFDPSVMSLHKIQTKLFKVTKQFVTAYKKYPYSFKLYSDLVINWAANGGLIHSPAAASVSCVGQFGIETGWAPLTTDFNGIGVAVTVCKLEDGQANICVSIDHRLWLGRTAGLFYTYLKYNIPKILEEGTCESQ